MKDQLKNEIKILEIVDHKNIIKMHAYFEDDKNIYLVLELGGKHLYDLVKSGGKMTEEQALKVSLFTIIRLNCQF